MNYPSRKRDNAKTKTTRDVNAATRVQLALKLRAQRLGWDEIAAQAGYGSRGAAHNAVMREMQRCVSQDVEAARREELVMLDMLQASIWPLAMDVKNRGRLFAVDRILSISERRARLMGLDLSSENAIAAAQIIVQEVPQGYLAVPAPQEAVEA